MDKLFENSGLENPKTESIQDAYRQYLDDETQIEIGDILS